MIFHMAAERAAIKNMVIKIIRVGVKGSASSTNSSEYRGVMVMEVNVDKIRPPVATSRWRVTPLNTAKRPVIKAASTKPIMVSFRTYAKIAIKA